MGSSRRIGLTFLFTVGSFLAACSDGGTAPITCAGDETCPAEARCVAGACVANGPPVAQIAALPPGLQAFALVTLDGSGSADPDAPRDAVAEWAWSVEALDAACAAPTVAGAEASVPVRFACPGRYLVHLVVRDAMGRESAPVQREVLVAASTGTPLVTASDDVVTNHACAGSPLRCAPVGGSIPLAASLSAALPAGVTAGWTVIPPPGRELGDSRRVLFSPGPDALAPVVDVETDGTAISGDWIFRYEVRDGAGVMGADAVRVSIGNTRPVIQETLPTFHHAFDAIASQLTVAASIPVAVIDPDGDPVDAPEVTWRHVGDGAATFVGSVLPGAVTVGIVVPYASRADGALLIGGPGLERSITFRTRDVNGAAAEETWPVVVANRPPELVAEAPAALVVPHRFDVASSRYLATAGLSRWEDPDGDPLEQTAATEDAVCASVTVVGGEVIASCEVPYAGVPRAGDVAGIHTVLVAPSDPWTSGAERRTSFEVTNRAPFVQPGVHTRASCVAGPCCKVIREPGVPEYCEEPSMGCEEKTATLQVVMDQDGDPVWMSVDGAAPVVCSGAACTATVTSPSFPASCSTPPPLPTVLVTATDGGAGDGKSVIIMP